ncbi:MAG: EAL domain-containing protein [Alphaproteobacteria bacterium]|uniref:EAL domain-containing protein n=1 Tax=Candidatus Nitrobium versatile TaxID=2884831 RepID=A0A953M183_9BACT|nr:EAL domain-containing protein [Candidatus Nitrobium versatile]
MAERARAAQEEWREEKSKLVARIEELSVRLREAEEALEAIGTGAIDAIAVRGPGGPRVFSLRGVETPYRTIVESISEGAATLNREGVVLYGNTRLSMMLRVPLEKILGSSFSDFVVQGDKETFAELLHRGVRQGARGELSVITGNSSVIPAYFSLSPLRIDNQRRLCMVITDLTEIRQAQEELRTAYNEMERRVRERTADLEQLTSSLRKEIAERKRLEEEMRHMAHHDTLTGLPNRRLFRDIVTLEMAQSRRNQKKFAVVFLDLDRFKEVNDTLGHETGDELLKEVAHRLRASIRESDTVARIGGDEFNLLLADLSHAEDSADVARKIIASFREPFLLAGQELHVTSSIGISLYPDDSSEIDTLFRYADIAMYHAKEKGKNTFQFYNPAINVRSLERIQMAGQLRQAIGRGELSVHYQPQVDLRTRRIVCAEALVRWQHPERGLLAPGHFIPLAEESGFITAIDEWVLRAVGHQVRSWREAGLSAPCVTVNLSARQFQSPGLVGTIVRILEETGMPPDCLALEITESIAMSDVERTAERLGELSKRGIPISLDDFGTGCSSLRSLKRLPISKLKIDRTFVQDIALDPDDQAIITAVIAMAHSMQMRVVAGGVETEEQLSFLHETACDEVQGYYFSEPLPSEKFKEFIVAGT